jgi:hypothetical protein
MGFYGQTLVENTRQYGSVKVVDNENKEEALNPLLD